ncbi:MAG TPA: helix-turn-helix transcriptional regulator [Caulobacteraceae bacterium]|nr:helix-turn-helix transcriptional regulator [Caulobacteraceae bacterium]
MSADDRLKALGREIRRHRRAKKLSQEQLAERAGLHRNYIGYLERGENSARIVTLFQITDALGIGLAELVAGLSPGPRDPAKEE